MRIKRKQRGEVMVLALSGKLTGGPDRDKFHSEIKALINEGFVDIVLDFSGVPWISSNGVGIIVAAYHTLTKHGGRMKICGLNDRSLSVLYVTRLHLVFEVYKSDKEAVASFMNSQVA